MKTKIFYETFRNGVSLGISYTYTDFETIKEVAKRQGLKVVEVKKIKE